MTAIEFNFLLLSLETKLSNFALKLTYDRDNAKDLTQDTMIKALIYREQFSDQSNLKAWVYTIMKNTFINDYKKNLRYKKTFNHTPDLYLLNSIAETNFETGESVCSTKDIQKEINNLTDELKVPFKMHFEGYKYSEIAEKLELKIGTVKSRIFIARKKLMEALDDKSYNRYMIAS